MKRVAKHPTSDEFRRGLFATRDIVESRPIRVVHWRIIRLLAGLACGFWALAICAILAAHRFGGGYDAVLFALGLPFALCAFAFRAFDKLKITRNPALPEHDL